MHALCVRILESERPGAPHHYAETLKTARKIESKRKVLLRRVRQGVRFDVGVVEAPATMHPRSSESLVGPETAAGGAPRADESAAGQTGRVGRSAAYNQPYDQHNDEQRVGVFEDGLLESGELGRLRGRVDGGVGRRRYGEYREDRLRRHPRAWGAPPPHPLRRRKTPQIVLKDGRRVGERRGKDPGGVEGVAHGVAEPVPNDAAGVGHDASGLVQPRCRGGALPEIGGTGHRGRGRGAMHRSHQQKCRPLSCGL